MKRRNEQGSILIALIVMLVVVSMGGVALTLTLQDYAQSTVKRRDELQAFYAAEAGALEVIGWFNMKGAPLLTAAPSLAPLFVKDSDDSYTALLAHLAGSSIDVATYNSSLLPVLRDTKSVERARVSDLKILPPTQPNPPIPYLLCIVHSEGEVSRTKSRKVAVLYVAYQRLKLEGSPGVIVSETAGASLGGNANGHWGEMWSHMNLRVLNLSQVPTQAQDPWLKYRSEASIEFNSTWKVPKWGKPYVAGKSGDIVTGTNYPCQGVAYGSIGTDYGTMMEQNQTLKWPTYDYAMIKKIAQKYGRYYGTDKAGNVYRNGIKDAAHLVSDLGAELNVAGARGANWPNVDYEVVMVDTFDGNPPAADFSNLATVSLSGGGGNVSWKGLYYMAVNFNVAGLGTGGIPAIPVEKPDKSADALNAFMDGLLYIAGYWDGSGNPCAFGSVVVENGFRGTGTLDVYYNWRIKDGFPVHINSLVDLKRWKIQD